MAERRIEDVLDGSASVSQAGLCFGFYRALHGCRGADAHRTQWRSRYTHGASKSGSASNRCSVRDLRGALEWNMPGIGRCVVARASTGRGCAAHDKAANNSVRRGTQDINEPVRSSGLESNKWRPRTRADPSFSGHRRHVIGADASRLCKRLAARVSFGAVNAHVLCPCCPRSRSAPCVFCV